MYICMRIRFTIFACIVVYSGIMLTMFSGRNVWEDIHPDSQDFVKDYLAQYPEVTPLTIIIPSPVSRGNPPYYNHT